MLNRLNNNSGLQAGVSTNNSQDFRPLNNQQSDGAVESVLVARVARLTNDGSSLGPGSYNVDTAGKAMSTSPRGGIQWKNCKSKRVDHFTKT